MAPRIAMVAGEASGDLLGERLIAALKQRYPQAEFFGIAGPRMQRAGCVSWHSAERLAVNGFVDALKRVPELLGIRSDLIRRLKAAPPDVFIGIDAPDFNLGLEMRLKRAGIATIHYVSPSIWAWRGWRARKLGAAARHVMCLFPCEPALYARVKVPATFVGHPLADEFPLHPDKAAAREYLDVPAAAELVVLMPGSRVGEVKALAGEFVKAARLLQAQRPTLRFLVPLASRPSLEIFQQALFDHAAGEDFPLRIMFGHSHEAMTAADVVVLASGTATLEAALLKRPMVVAYRMGKWSFRLIKRMAYLPWVSLPNILSRETLVTELLQDDCTAEKLAAATLKCLDDGEGRLRLQRRFEQLHQELKRDCASRAAEVVAQVMAER